MLLNVFLVAPCVFSNDINFYYVLHETGNGQFAYSKGRPSSLSKGTTGTRLPCCEDVENRIRQMRSDNGLLDSTKMLVLISLATNDMVKFMCMHPNVWFMDCTSGMNREKKDLFVVAVRSAARDTLPVNLTVISSAQKWVFGAICMSTFPHLYTPDVCVMNRLVLTHEDKSKYEPFQLAIETTHYFQQSKVMLCTFHVIWMSFKIDLYPVLDGIVHGGALSGFSTFSSFFSSQLFIVDALLPTVSVLCYWYGIRYTR